MYRIEKATNDIILDGWNGGITDNPYEGIYDMRNCDAVTIPGEVSVAMATQSMISQGMITNATFTIIDVPNAIWQYNGVVPLEVGTAITVTNSGGALPNGLSAYTTYYVKTILSGTTFNISNSLGGAKTTTSNTGTGTNTFSTINMGLPKFFTSAIVTSSWRAYFVLDDVGRAWVLYNIFSTSPRKWVYMSNLPDENPINNGFGNGLVAWSNYLFVFSSVSVNAININLFSAGMVYSYITNRANWVNTWQSTSGLVEATGSHYAIVSINDDSVYFCNGQSIGLIAFDTSAIDNPNQSPFSLAKGRTVSDGVTTLNSTTITSATMNFTQADVGSYITSSLGFYPDTYIVSINSASSAVISQSATASNTNLTFTIPQTYVYNESILKINSGDRSNCLAELGSNLEIGGINNYIYPWDRISPNFSTPIFLSENFVSRMVTVNTTMYIFCGYKGRIFVTNGANATPFYKIPDYLSLTTNPYFIWTDVCFNRNQLYFGFKVTDNAGNTLSTMGGLWAIDIDSVTPTAPRLQNIMSYGTYAGYVNALSTDRLVNLHGLTVPPASDGYGLFMGWFDGVATNGIDVGISTPYLAGQSFVDTDPVPIGQYLTEKTLSGLEYKLGQPLASGESVAIAYRTSLTGNYTDNPLDTYITGNVSGWGVPIFEKSQWVQFRITLTSTATNPSYCRVREIRLHLT